MKKYFIAVIALVCGTTMGYADGEKPAIELSSSSDISTQVKKTRTLVAQITQENGEVLKEFDRFSDLLKQANEEEKSLNNSDVEKILKGVEFAADKHRLQTRKNKEKTPYIAHPIGVAENLMKTGNVRDASMIIGALLHDTLEDTQTTFSEIEKAFGKDVANYVKELSCDKGLTHSEKNRRQVIEASHKSAGAAQIKLADKLANLSELTHNPPSSWTQERVDQYYEWAQSVIDRLPAANPALKKAVDDLVDQYWEKQDSKS